MSHSAQAVAAAIAAIAERGATEAGIPATDTDGMGKLMASAEQMVAHQLARTGMALKDAADLAERASMMPGRDTAESEALADDAYRNRHAGLPAAAPAADPAAATDDVADAAIATTAGIQPARAGSAAAIDIPRAPSAVRPHVVREPKPMGFEVASKKVHEVFRGIQPADADFDFEIPVVNWDGNHPKIPDLDPAYLFDTGALHTVLYAIAEGASLNIVGPHGCGKTEIVRQVAARLNFPVSTLPMDGQLSRRELIGQEKLRATENGNESYFAPGVLPRALAEPGFILFDEVDRGVSDLQYACHSVYLQHGLSVLEDGGRFIPFHRHNRVFGTANTKGRGSADGMYQPPEEMSEATRDRWSLWLDMDYPVPEADAQVILNKTPGILAEHAEHISLVASQIREAYKDGRLAQTCSMRQQLETARMAVFLCRRERDDIRRLKALRFAVDRVIGGRASDADKIAIDGLVQIRIPQAFQGDPFL